MAQPYSSLQSWNLLHTSRYSWQFRSHIFRLHEDVRISRSRIGNIVVCGRTCESSRRVVVSGALQQGLTWLQIIVLCIYRVTLHPLAKYPGPLLAKLTTLRGAYYAYHGDMHLDIERCHQKYGESSYPGRATLLTSLLANSYDTVQTHSWWTPQMDSMVFCFTSYSVSQVFVWPEQISTATWRKSRNQNPTWFMVWRTS